MLLLSLGRTAFPPSLPKLHLQSLIQSHCPLQQHSTLRCQLYGVHSSSSLHDARLKWFSSQTHDLAEAGEGLVVSEHGPGQYAPSGFHARMIRAREAAKPVNDLENSASEVSRFRKVVAVRRERREARTVEGRNAFDWFDVVMRIANLRRRQAEGIEDDITMEWMDVNDANIQQLAMLVAAQRAATDAEKALQQADPTDSASMDEARRLEDHATRLADLAAKQMETYEDLRAKARAKVDAHPTYLEMPEETDLYPTAHTDSHCRICLFPHSPSVCPHLFENPKDWVVEVVAKPALTSSILFQKRWEVDAPFREAILYLRSKFSRAPGSNHVLPMRQHMTRKAPAS